MEYEYNSFLKVLGRRVKQLRLERGWTQRHVVLTFGFHDTYWRKIERGQGISIPTLLRLADLFNITLEELIQGLSDQLLATPIIGHSDSDVLKEKLPKQKLPKR